MSLLELQKTLGSLLMPAGLLWVLLGALAFLLLRRRQRLLALLGALVWALYGLAGNYYVGTALMAGLERSIPVADSQGEPFDAAFVLGGGTELGPAGTPILGSAGDRVAEAARLWHAGRTRFLVASGWGRDAATGPRDLGEETRVLWMGLGVPREAIVVVDTPCWVTRDEIRAYRPLADRMGWRRMALVSSAWHLPRALVLAKRAGLEVHPVGSDWRGRGGAFLLHHLVPEGEGFQRTSLACWEHLGHMVGR
jgi:uncharacterized SAM-binding protein YcdF (DUF218 family)